MSKKEKVKYNRVKAVLSEKERTSKWLSLKINKSKATVSRWCSNEIQPSIENFYKIADILDVEVGDLLVDYKKKKKG